MPKSLRAYARQYQPMFAKWFKERCVESEIARTSAADLIADFREWAPKPGDQITDSTFGELMATRAERRRSNVIWYVGVCLKD